MSWQERAFARRQALLLHSDLFGSSSSDDEARPTRPRLVTSTSSTSSSSDDGDRGTRVIEPPRVTVATVGLGAAAHTDLPEPAPAPEPRALQQEEAVATQRQRQQTQEPKPDPEPEPEPEAVDSFGIGTAAISGAWQACSPLGAATAVDLRRRRAARAARNRHRVEQTANRRHQTQLAGKSSLPRFDAALSAPRR